MGGPHVSVYTYMVRGTSRLRVWCWWMGVEFDIVAHVYVNMKTNFWHGFIQLPHIIWWSSPIRRVEKYCLTFCQLILVLGNGDDSKSLHIVRLEIGVLLWWNHSIHLFLYSSSLFSAFSSWLKFMSSFPKEFRDIFNTKVINMGHFAKSLGLTERPKVLLEQFRDPVPKTTKNRLTYAKR